MSTPDLRPPASVQTPVVPAWAMAAAAAVAALVFGLFIHRSWREQPHESGYYAGIHSTMGILFFQQGKAEEAAVQFRRSIELKEGNAEAMSNLGNALLQQGKWDEAVASYRKAFEMRPDYAEAQNNLGLALIQKNLLDEAIGHFHAALDLRPGYADAENNLGYALLQKGRYKDAEPHFRESIKLNAGNAQCHHNLALCLFAQGRVKEAIERYQTAIDTHSRQLGSINNLAWLLSTTTEDSLRDGARALRLAQTANELSGGGNAVVLHTLAAAQAEAGQYADAVQTARLAIERARADNNAQLLEATRQQLQEYEAGKPYREAVLPPSD